MTKTTQSNHQVIESVDKVNYEVGYKLYVIYDSASGRVTVYDYTPFKVKEINKENV